MGSSRFYGAGRINVFSAAGGYREMGREYGRFFKKRLADFYDVAVDGYFIKKEKQPYLKLLALSRLIFRKYPSELKEMVSGISEGSGISMNRIIMLDQLNSFELVRNQGIGRCSNIAAWGGFTKDGRMVFGRNFDQPEYFKKFGEFLTVAVFAPDGSIPVANICYAGQVGINTAVNGCGVVLVNNEAPVLKEDRIDLNAPNILAAEFLMLGASRTAGELDAKINSSRTNCPIIVTTADGNLAYTYEWIAPSIIKRRSGEKCGIMAATNHFVEPSWSRGSIRPGSYGLSDARYDNILSLGEKYKNTIDAKKMKELLGIYVKYGGATHPDTTAFQTVILPSERKVHIKVPGLQDWTEIDLDRLFKKVPVKI